MPSPGNFRPEYSTETLPRELEKDPVVEHACGVHDTPEGNSGRFDLSKNLRDVRLYGHIYVGQRNPRTGLFQLPQPIDGYRVRSAAACKDKMPCTAGNHPLRNI